MKKIYVYIVMLIGVGLGVSSCYSDDSSLDLYPIAGVEIDTTGMSNLYVYQYEALVVEPKMDLGGLSEEDVSYQWKINLNPNDTVYEVIGEERNLNYEMEFKPNTSGYEHQLWYTVTDQVNDLEYIMTWPLIVRNNIGEGLVIAETADGVTSDISHIMAEGITSDYIGESIKYQIYTTNNSQPLEGVVKQMRFAKVFGVDVIMGITDNSVFKINTFDYTLGGINDDLFYGSSEEYKPQALGAIVQGDMYVGNGMLTGTFLGASRQFGMPLDFPFSVPDHVAFNAHTYNPPVMVNFYDEVNQHFVYLPTLSTFGDNSMHVAAPAAAGVFNPADVQNKENLAAAVSNTGDFRHILKDKTTGDISLYVLDGGQSNYPNIISPAPKALYDLSNAPGIDQASHFTFLDDQQVMYYVSGNTIYAMLYGGSTPVFEERFMVPAGEEVTTLQVYRQADYPQRYQDDEPYLPTNNRQLIMSTYGSEGTVYLLPFINTGVGNIDQTRIKTFGGFERITAITTQL